MSFGRYSKLCYWYQTWKSSIEPSLIHTNLTLIISKLKLQPKKTPLPQYRPTKPPQNNRILPVSLQLCPYQTDTHTHINTSVFIWLNLPTRLKWFWSSNVNRSVNFLIDVCCSIHQRDQLTTHTEWRVLCCDVNSAASDGTVMEKDTCQH